MPVHNKPNLDHESRCIGFSETLEKQRIERDRRARPQPWIARKLTVGIVAGIVGFAYYVYIARFCLPMILRKGDAMGGREMGIAFLVVFCVLGFMFLWSYIKAVLTPAGFARDFVSKAPPPNNAQLAQRRPPWESDSDIATSNEGETRTSNDASANGAGPPPTDRQPAAAEAPRHGKSFRVRGSPSHTQGPARVESMTENRAPATASSTETSAPQENPQGAPRRKPSRSDATNPRHADSRRGRRTSETRSQRDHLPSTRRRLSDAATHRPPSRQAAPDVVAEAVVTDAAPTAPVTRRPTTDPKLMPLPPAKSRNDGLPPLMFSRRPSTTPVLSPEYRYCTRDELLKPMRTHHCRACGTCVLMYDHHCPWIGQCVGAFNHKFFVNFLQWSTPFTLWILLSMAVLIGLSSKKDPNFNLDPAQIVLIALSGFFTLFTTVLLISHVRLIILNQTTVESLNIQRMVEREQATLSQMTSPLEFGKRRRIRRMWDQEWGRPHMEGNLWWLGSARVNWEARMGANKWGWFLPVGRSQGDGLTYPTNPRCDSVGRWRRRTEWPVELSQ